MRHLVVCCDGTWNTPEQMDDGVLAPTNVVKLHNALAERTHQGVEQIAYYHPGVGTDGTLRDKLLGGGTGVGLSENVMSGYRWLGGEYQSGDRIFLFGFSRGAFTVRSLAGLIATCGLLDLQAVPENRVWARVKKAYDRGYRAGKARETWTRASWAFHQDLGGADPVPIHFLGVWDTVGALGIPDDLAILNLLDNPQRYRFHDTTLSDGVHIARHAVALDEQRASFMPTLWQNAGQHEDAVEVWFPGVHSDVGGGYAETGLSDIALEWMMDEAQHAAGLGFRQGVRGQLVPSAHGQMHDSVRGAFKYLRTSPRNTPEMREDNPRLAPAACQRHRDPPITQAAYRLTHRLKPGESRTYRIFARQRWNDLGLYMESGVRYRFEATGEWLDWKTRSGPDGPIDTFDVTRVGNLVGSVVGAVENLFKHITDNQRADFIGSKRVESEPWFALIGVVANGGTTLPDGHAKRHEVIAIGKGGEFTPKAPGYLYCFANDAWHAYDNNRGSVALEVTRA